MRLRTRMAGLFADGTGRHRPVAFVALVAGALAALPAAAADYAFGVLAQRSAQLTAEYWNPILDHVGRQAGVRLVLKIARTSVESSEATGRGDYDFVYSYHVFRPSVRDYRVILRSREPALSGQIVAAAGGSVADLRDLAGQAVGFPSTAAFMGYVVPFDQLLRRGIEVTPVFGGNQEGIMAQLKAGRIAAAGVNSGVMQGYAAREGFRYRVLWESPPFPGLPVAAHARVPPAVVAAVGQAFAGLHESAEGQRVLAAAAAVVGQKPPLGFVAATPADYRDYVEFYRRTVVRDVR